MRRMTLTAALAVGLFCGASDAQAQNWGLYHHQSAPQFTTSLGAKRLADNIEKETNGEIKVRLHLAGTLQIATNNITSAVAQGVVQMGDDLFYSGNVPIGALLRLPFLVQSYEEFEKAREVLQPYVEKGFADKGVTVLAGYAYPLQYIWGNKGIQSLDGLEGAKIRVASPEQSEFVRRFGGTPVTIGASEVPSALERGVVDGIITGTVGADLWKDLLRDGYLMGLNFNNAYYIVNTAAFERLNDQQKGGVRKAAKEAAEWNQETMRKDDQEIVDRLKAAGMKVAEPTKEELNRAVKEMQPYWDQWAQERGPEAVEALQKVRQALGR